MNDINPADPSIPAFLAGGGEAATLIAAMDWSSSPLGPLHLWSPTLTGTVALILRSPVPIVTLWGEDGVMIYNDAYSRFAGGRHPRLFGSKVREGWVEVAAFNDHVMKVGLSGRTLRYEDQELTLYRNGVAEQVWMNLDYSPIIDERGLPVAVIAIVVETTAKVRAQRWLRGERERLRRMFEQAPGFMAMLTGPDHVFELANAAYEQLVGARNVLGKTVREALPELEGQGFFELLDEVYRSGTPFAGNAHAITLKRRSDASSEERFVDLVYQPVRNEEGDVIGIFVQGTDITDRLLAEQSMHASEEKFRTFAQVMPNQVWAAQRDGQLNWFNDQVYDYSGAARASLDGAGWARIVHPEDFPDAARRWRHAVETGSIYESEFRVRRADGVYRWHIGRALPIRDKAGGIASWIGTNTDIEDQKSAARALERLNKTLEQQVIESIHDRDRMWRLSTDIMLVANFNAIIVAVNPAWTQLLGWEEHELLGRSFMEMVHPADRADTLVEVDALSRGVRTFKFVNRCQRRDGAYVTLAWTAVPDDRFIHAVGRDITADREAAEALRRTELALQQSQKLETIGKLTGGVAHDFNNLLQVISGNLQLLETDVAGNERAERRLTNALGGVNRGAKLASQLLAFGRRQALEPKTLKIGRLILGMEDMLRRTLGEAVEIETVVSASLWNTFADPTQIENALLNLAINARDAMDGTGKLTVEAGNALLDDDYARGHTDVVPGQYVMLAVTDTGCGMAPDVLAQAYEPFFSTKPEGKGSGLGLSMVYGFVKQSGGHLKIYTEPEYGTTVKLYLPRTHDEEDMAPPIEITTLVGGAETILVVEDDDGVRATVMEMLIGLGYCVLKADDAASALAIIDSGIPVDLLFTDVVMPGTLRSPELARRARERLPNMEVLFTSGYTENAIVHGGRLDAGVALLGKPYTREALARKIRQVLSNREQRITSTPLALSAYDTSGNGLSQAQPLVILFVEDDDLIRSATCELLREMGHTVVEAADAASALIILETNYVDLLITDVQLPGLSGEELAKRARAMREHIGVVFATGEQHVSEVPGYRVLRKPYDLPSLLAALAVVR
jgi:PAS domain S-box-containing protein